MVIFWSVGMARLLQVTAGPHQQRESSSAPVDRAFRLTIVLKALDGILEVLGGVLLLFVSPASLRQVVRWVTAHELAQDPKDFIARHLLHSASQLTRSRTLYGAVYLLGHGVGKVVLAVLVLRERLWAYPAIIVLLAAFIAYQLYRITQHATVALVALTAFDALVVALTAHEYRRRRRDRAASARP